MTMKFSIGSIYEQHAAYLTDKDDTTCLQVQQPTSTQNFLKFKIFNYNLCLNASMITLITENIPCDGNRMVIYSPNVANEISACDFTGYFIKYENNGQSENGMKYECKYVITDENIVTCDFVFVAIYNVPTGATKMCEISFNIN